MAKHSQIDSDTGNTTSDTVVAQLAKSYLGLLQVKINFTTAATITLTVEGRTIPGAEWATLTTITEADLPGSGLGVNHSIYKAFNMLHEMRVVVTNANAATTHTTYLQEY